MQISTKGQVTIPQEIRNRLGLLPHTKVEFELAGDHARIRKARQPPGESVRGRLALSVLRGTADTNMSTDEILVLTRGETRATTRGSDASYPQLTGPPERLPWRPRGQQRPA
jgi:AbrB family looped-hinge helix DNA binding protein